MVATLAFLAMWGAFAFSAQSGEMNLEECSEGVCHLQLHPAMLLRQNGTGNTKDGHSQRGHAMHGKSQHGKWPKWLLKWKIRRQQPKVDDFCSEKTKSSFQAWESNHKIPIQVYFADCENGAPPSVQNEPLEKARNAALIERCRHYETCVRGTKGDHSVQHRMPKGFEPKAYCSMANGALTDPIVRFTGTEELQQGTKKAQDWDWLWWAAKNGLGNDGATKACKGKGLAPGCALLVNPVCARGQDQLHIHNRVLKAGWYEHKTKQGKKERRDCRGGDLSRRMQQEVCSNKKYMQTFVKIDVSDLVPNCKGATTNYARYFRNFPQVFTEAEKAEGWEKRGGITVWPCYRGALLLQEGEEEQERVSFQPNQKHIAATKQKAFNTGFTNNGIKGGASQNGKPPACYDLNVPDKARTEGYVVMITSCNIEHLIFGPQGKVDNLGDQRNVNGCGCQTAPPFRYPDEFNKSTYLSVMKNDHQSGKLRGLLTETKDQELRRTFASVCPLHCDTVGGQHGECKQFENQFFELGNVEKNENLPTRLRSAAAVKARDGLGIYAYTALWGCSFDFDPDCKLALDSEGYYYSADLLEKRNHKACASNVKKSPKKPPSCATIRPFYKILNLYLRLDCVKIHQWAPLMWRIVEEIRTRPYRPAPNGNDDIFLYRNDESPKRTMKEGQTIQYGAFVSTTYDRCYSLQFDKDDPYWIVIHIPNELAKDGVYGMRYASEVSFFGDGEREVLIEPYYRFRVKQFQRASNNVKDCTGRMKTTFRDLNNNKCVKGVLLEALGPGTGLPDSKVAVRNRGAVEGYNGPIKVNCKTR